MSDKTFSELDAKEMWNAIVAWRYARGKAVNQGGLENLGKLADAEEGLAKVLGEI